MPAEVHVHHEVHHPKKPTKPQHPHHHEAAAVPAQHHVLPHQLKGFLEGGVAAIVAGVSTHPLDLIKVRMQVGCLRCTVLYTVACMLYCIVRMLYRKAEYTRWISSKSACIVECLC